jgi:hypothetical protein
MQITWTPLAHVTLELVICAACGCPFSFPKHLVAELQKTGDTFYCPMGHQNVYKNSLAKQLAAERKKREAAEKALADTTRKAESATARADWYERCHKEERVAHQDTRKTLGNTRRTLTTTKKKLAAGQCPCCKERFPDLAAHMEAHHPDYHAPEPQSETH